MRIITGTALLPRGPGRVKIGGDSRGGLDLDGLGAHDIAALNAALGRRDPHLGPPPPLSVRLRLRLQSAGLIEGQRPTLRLRVTTLDRLSFLLVESLAHLYSLRVDMPSSVRVDRELASELGASSYGTLAASSAQLALKARGANISVENIATPDLVIASFQRSAEVEDLRTFILEDIAHLVLVREEKGVTVGPLVIPGRTACARCEALGRADQDPFSPFDRLVSTLLPTPRIHPLALHQAVLTGYQMIAAFLNSPTQATTPQSEMENADEGLHVDSDPQWAHRVICIDQRGRCTRHALNPHPQCGCGAHPSSFTAHPPCSLSCEPPSSR